MVHRFNMTQLTFYFISRHSFSMLTRVSFRRKKNKDEAAKKGTEAPVEPKRATPKEEKVRKYM